jgi:hypothetical protein
VDLVDWRRPHRTFLAQSSGMFVSFSLRSQGWQGTGANRALLAAMDCAYHLTLVANQGLITRKDNSDAQVLDVMNSAAGAYSCLQVV